MPITEGGEFERSGNAPEQEKDVNKKLFDIYSGISIQNTHPEFSEQPDGIFYWKEGRLETVKQGLETMEILNAEGGMSEIVNPFNPDEKVSLPDFIAKVKKSIAYSEQMAEQVKNQPKPNEEDLAKKRAEIKRRLLGEE